MVRNYGFTCPHPYYTQQLSSQVWDMMTYDNLVDGVVEEAVSMIVRIHDLDFERLWLNFNRTDRSIMMSLRLQARANSRLTTATRIPRILKSCA